MNADVPAAEPGSPSSPRFRKILVANRGEVAVRVIRACRELGIASVAVYSDADRQALHVTRADEAVYLGSSAASDSYLNQPRLLEAARLTGSDAVHPGFGFLAENPEFAALVRSSGIAFIGPSTDAMRLMASKAIAREFVGRLGIPVIPGDDGRDQSPPRLAAAATELGYPVLIKAAAGGGGTGIRVVRRPADFLGELASARQEAASAFGDPRLVIERYCEQVRHVEVQLVADHFGNVVHCFDRECSIQRRRQKVIEEAPAACVDPDLRVQLAQAAVRIAESVGYSGLGTVEFLVDERDGGFYFLEMNTRLQVEHGLTELVTGLDLVRWQIEIAEGRPLGRRQEEISSRGHAIECRLYAEDPEADFAPAAGQVLHWAAAEGPNVRVDTAVESGSQVSPYYDAMLAKLMAWGPDRCAAIRTMSDTLARTQVMGLTTNQRFLSRALRHAQFVAGLTTTRFVELNREDLIAPPGPAESRRALLAAVVHRWRLRRGAAVGPSSGECSFIARVAGQEHRVSLIQRSDACYHVAIDGRSFEIDVLSAKHEHSLWMAVDGHAAPHVVMTRNEAAYVFVPGAGSIRVDFLSRFRSRPREEAAGSCRAVMTGRVVDVHVASGARVRAGDRLLTLESMKMEHATVAASDGIVTRLWVTTGQVVEQGALLVEIETGSAAATPPIQGD